MNHLGNERHDAARHEPNQEKFPHEAHPPVIRNIGHAQSSHKGGRCRQDIITESITKIKGKDGGLAGNAQHIS